MTNIQWFPGHMTKAKRQMQESMKLVDMVIELRDARIPNASKNPMIEKLINQKPRLIILTKKDKTDLVELNKWLVKLSVNQDKCIAVDLLHDNMTKIIRDACLDVMKEKIARQIKRGIKPRAIRAIVVGIPNVGKSTMINQIAKKRVVEASNRPGVTKALKWIKIQKDIELLDTPGVLWPKFENQHVGLLLALTGAIKDDILNLEDLVRFALQYILENYPNKIEDHYQVSNNLDITDLICEIGRNRHLIAKNDQVDYERTIKFILKDIRDSKLGSIIWEKIDEENMCE